MRRGVFGELRHVPLTHDHGEWTSSLISTWTLHEAFDEAKVDDTLGEREQHLIVHGADGAGCLQLGN
jgi:hypothetical protein